MRTHRIGPFEASVIGLGTSEFGGKCPESKAREFMDTYLVIGGNLIDTARVYGDFVTPKNGESEKVIGRWLSDRHCREQIVLSTKGGHPPLGNMTKSRLDRSSVRDDIQRSLEDLQTDHADIYWLHRDDTARPVGEIMETLQGLIEDGLTRLTGVSNWHPERILEAQKYAMDHGLAPLSANQPQFSLARPAALQDRTLAVMDHETWRMHKDTNLACFCSSSQAQGFFAKLETLGADALPEGMQRTYATSENLAVYDRLKALSQKLGVSVSACALSFLTSQPFPTFALVGASRIEQVCALKEAADVLLSDADRDRLRQV